MLKWLRTGNWPSLEKILSAIRQELQSVQPIDTASIRWEKDAEGMRAYYTGRTGGGESLTVDEGGESAEDGLSYNGYFTIKLKVVDGDSYVVVCDGATWDSESETSADSLLHINQVNMWVPCTIIDEKVSSSKYVVIQSIDEIPGDPDADPPIETIPATYGPILMDIVPNDTYSAIYRVIGRVIVDGDSITIQQDHTTGVLYALQFRLCDIETIEQPIP